MNAKIKKQWVKELRSGEWAQGRLTLMSNNDEACCLGVLCDIAIRHGVIDPWLQRAPHDANWRIGSTDEAATLPREVWKWAGLDRDNPVVGNDGLTLMHYNDSIRLPFPQIADLIEEFL